MRGIGGIVGYVGHRDAVSFLIPGLCRLEYRGYNSAGVATVSEGRLDVREVVGKLATLKALIALPLRLLAYHLGVLRGCDVDRPRTSPRE